MRHLLEKRMMEIVQPEVMPEFEIKLESFRFEQRKRKPKYARKVDQVTEKFRGPQYPIGRD